MLLSRCFFFCFVAPSPLTASSALAFGGDRRGCPPLCVPLPPPPSCTVSLVLPASLRIFTSHSCSCPSAAHSRPTQCLPDHDSTKDPSYIRCPGPVNEGTTHRRPPPCYCGIALCELNAWAESIKAEGAPKKSNSHPPRLRLCPPLPLAARFAAKKRLSILSRKDEVRVSCAQRR